MESIDCISFGVAARERVVTQEHVMIEISDDGKRNREKWTKANADYTDEQASHKWAAAEITWGVFGVPEASLGTLGEVRDLDVVELGCGTAYVSAWLARRGARPVGVDVTPAQLATARKCQREFGIDFPLIEASAEQTSTQRTLAWASADIQQWVRIANTHASSAQESRPRRNSASRATSSP